MRVLAGILGVIVGFAVGIVFTEVIFPNNHEWPIVLPFGLAALGWLVGSSSVRRFSNRNPKPS